MNPYSGPVSRKGFLVLNLAYLTMVILGGLLIDLLKHTPNYGYGFAFGYALFVGAVALILITYVRRIQSTGQTLWLGLLGFIPVIGIIYYFSLFFWPQKK